MTRNADDYEYDLALSFAGEDRHVAGRLTELLRFYGVRVFYHRHEQANLLGKDLYQYLQQIYRDEACFCAILVSKAYVNRLWTKYEPKQAQARASVESHEYILPLRLDDTEVPGISSATGCVDLRETSIEDVAEIIVKKITESRDYRTWHLTPTAMDKFSPKLRDTLDHVVSRVVSELERIVARNKNQSPVLIDSDRNKLNLVATETELDIETTIIDDAGVFIHHPWPSVIGRTVQDQWMGWEGFAKWQLETILHLKKGYLTWKDNYSSDLDLATELIMEKRRYERRTLVGFRRLPVTASVWWNIMVEAHEVATLGAAPNYRPSRR